MIIQKMENKLLVDAHCHLDHEWFKEDLDEVISRAREAGVKAIITNGVDNKSNIACLELAKKHDIVKAALGIYPDYASTEDISKGLEFIEKNKAKICAIGEIGLDYKGDKSEKDIAAQKKLFSDFLELAERIKKPIIVHSRKAEADVIEILQSSKLKKVVMHCFNGNFKLVKKIADNKWSFSIPTSITRSEHFQKIVKEVDISKILTETDAPFQSPYREKRNEPAFIAEAITKIAELKRMEECEVTNNIYMNYERMFC